MSRFNTGNPIGSDALKDLSDNAKNVDLIVNSDDPSFVNRFGELGLTWRGVQNIATGDLSVAIRAAAESLNSAQASKEFAAMAASATASGFTGVYKSKLDGLRETDNGQLFWVADGELILYLNSGGVAETVLNYSTKGNATLKVLGLTQAGEMPESFSSTLGAVRRVTSGGGLAVVSTSGPLKLNGMYRNTSGAIRVFARCFGLDSTTGVVSGFYLKINSFTGIDFKPVDSITVGPYSAGPIDLVIPLHEDGKLFSVEVSPEELDKEVGLNAILIENSAAIPLSSYANLETGEFLDKCISFFSQDGKTLNIKSDYLFLDGVSSVYAGGDCIVASAPLLEKGKALYMKISARHGVRDSPIFTQTADGVSGRLQLYANRVGATRNGVGYINLFVDGSSLPPLPPYPFSCGEELHIVMDYREDETLTLYFNGSLWGTLRLSNGVAQLNSRFIPYSDGAVTVKKIAVAESSDVHLLTGLSERSPTYIEPLILSAEAAASEKNGSAGFSKNMHAKLQPASLTKMMSVALAIESKMPMNEFHKIIESDATGGSGNNLKTGDEVTLIDLLYNMMLPSSNVSATAVARIIAGSQSDFVSMMNTKARSLGMDNTSFKNPHGLNASGHLSTASDMLKLLKYCSSLKTMREIWSKPEHSFRVEGVNPRQLTVISSVKNINDQQVLGGKTGTLGSKSSLATFGTSDTGGFFYGVIINSPNDSDRYSDMDKLLNGEGCISSGLC